MIIPLHHTIRGSRADGSAPVIALHGGLMSGETFGRAADALAQTRQVIAVDLQAHGRTPDAERPMTFEAMADDVGALIDQLISELDVPQVDVVGYSLGGGVAVQTALRHRARVRRLVVMSTAFAHAGWYPDVRAGFAGLGPHLADMMKPSPQYQHYMKVAPRPDFGNLLGKLGTLMRQDYDWTARVTDLPPTLLAYGDCDSLALAHVLDVFRRMGGDQKDAGWDGAGRTTASQLAILPGVTHYTMGDSLAAAAAIDAFLSAR
jgi:pimeloyl-ACP methyl ester carboxylesterase